MVPQFSLCQNFNVKKTTGGILSYYDSLERPLDAFDQELLNENVQGQQRRCDSSNRVSLASKYFDTGEDSGISPRAWGPAQQPKLPDSVRDTIQGSKHGLSNFTNHTRVESSSDYGPLSSPTYRASQKQSSTHIPPKTEYFPRPSELYSPSATRGAASKAHIESTGRNFDISAKVSGFRELRTKADRTSLPHANTPLIQGIRLVSLNELPDRFRSIFPFPIFNAVQSKCFNTVYKSRDNLVLSAPTGSGKTAIFEIAICSLIASSKNEEYKIVYQAPTKSLCSQRYRDWQSKFATLGLRCAELTGDTEYSNLQNVQSANIIIITPEKWDSITRKWKDHEKLMKMIKLFLIDEVHILKESRGAALEAVVSRIKSSGCDVRFVALSATVPNIEDVAEWLGPARCEKFGEEFRPVKLEKHVYGYNSTGNDFAFDKTCETKLPGVIAKHSAGKPIMIFCCTRNSCISTAKLLANFWASARPQDRCWNAPGGQMIIENSDLRGTVTSGVAFHHAGLTPGDRHAVENGFLGNQLGVICCTSTLAVGVNLPCHLVIVKGTVSWQESGCREYPDLEMMQMLGRAGRPQFDDSAVGVILTRKERMSHYEKMVAGEERLESCLHLNLIDHLNAEIGLGTVYDIPSATRWLAGTFLFVRLKTNPDHYKLDGDTQAALDQDERLEEICGRDIKLLEETKLITVQGRIKSTELGDAMSRYYVKYKTMKTLLSLSRKASISEILSVLAQADEFHGVRLKSGERAVYKTLNKNNGIKYPIEVDIALSAHKISLIVQSELGGIDFPAEEQYKKHKTQYLQDKGIIFQHIHRLVRCIIDCQIHLQDAVTVRHALEFSRSLGARVWDNSPLELKQIETIGNVGVRRLVSANINSVETLEGTEARRIEMILSRYPPYGTRILTALKAFPKLRVRVKLMGKDVKPGIQVKVKVKAEISFMNEETPTVFRKRPIYVCFLVELSDGHLIDFRRISATKLQNTLDVFLSVDLWNEHQYITCSVMCDDIAGTYRTAQLQPGLPASIFPLPHNEEQSQIKGPDSACLRKPEMNISRRRSREGFCKAMDLVAEESENFFGDLDDQDLLAAENMEFRTIDDFEDRPPGRGFMATNPHTQKINKNLSSKPAAQESEEDALDYTQLSNGKWACNHKCKDKTSCKHMCCRDGLNKKPKPRKASSNTQAPKEIPKTSLGGKVTKPRTPLIQKPAPRRVATVGLANEPREEGLSGEGMNRLDSLWERLSDNNQVGKPMTCKKMLNDIPETVVAEAPKAASEVRQMDSVPATLLGATRSKNLKGWPKSPPTTPWDSYGTNPALLGMSDLPIQSECIPNKKVPAKILGSSNYYEDDLRDDLPLEEELLNTVQAHKLNDIPFLEAGIIGLEDSMARPNLEREQPQRFLKDYQAADDYGIMDWSSLNWSSSPIRDKRARSPSMASAIDRPNKRSLFVTGLSSDGVPSSQSPEKAVGKRPQEELWNIDLESGSETGYGKKKIEELNAIQDSSNEMREFRQSCASLKQHLERINSNPGWAKDFDIQEVELLSRYIDREFG
ncbi:MAG: Sec63 [Cirrosporium novae-zelandiae]|nr:MAG: Sec63 [Cirrosporium novae-zelandiae]